MSTIANNNAKVALFDWVSDWLLRKLTTTHELQFAAQIKDKHRLQNAKDDDYKLDCELDSEIRVKLGAEPDSELLQWISSKLVIMTDEIISKNSHDSELAYHRNHELDRWLIDWLEQKLFELEAAEADAAEAEAEAELEAETIAQLKVELDWLHDEELTEEYAARAFRE